MHLHEQNRISVQFGFASEKVILVRFGLLMPEKISVWFFAIVQFGFSANEKIQFLRQRKKFGLVLVIEK